MTRGRRLMIAAALILYCAATAGDVVSVYLLSDLIDGALADGSLAELRDPALVWAGVTLAAATATYGASVLTARAGELFAADLRAATHDHLLHLSPERLGGRSLGDLLSREVDDVEDVEHLAVTGLVDAVACAVSVLAFGAAALWLSWHLAVLVLVCAPLVWLLNRWLTGRSGRVAMQARVAHGQLTAAVEQGLSNAALVQAHTAHRHERARLAASARTLVRARLRQNRYSAAQGPLTEVVETAGLLAVLAVGVLDIAAGTLTVGGLLAFTAYLTFLYPPLTSLGQLGLTASLHGAGAARLAELLDLAPDVLDPYWSDSPTRADGRLVVEGASVAGRLAPVSFAAGPGELLMITGPSGCGKTTLAGLLVRFRDPDGGRITLDGVDLWRYPLDRLRATVTLLAQEPYMFDDTVRANLAYGSDGATTGAIRVVTDRTGASSFLDRLPQGLGTSVGGGGRALSGGQRQRLALTRALLRDGRVLVADEPTTGLDPDAAHQVLATLRDRARDATVIVITHDRSLLGYADRVVTLPAWQGAATPG